MKINVEQGMMECAVVSLGKSRRKKRKNTEEGSISNLIFSIFTNLYI